MIDVAIPLPEFCIYLIQLRIAFGNGRQAPLCIHLMFESMLNPYIVEIMVGLIVEDHSGTQSHVVNMVGPI